MSVGNKVLQALSILTSEDISKLSSIDEEILAFEQVAGEEWVGTPAVVRKQQMAKILSFPKAKQLKIQEIESLSPGGEETPETLNELTMDFILSQRELWKQWVKSVGTSKAVEGYINQLDLISIKKSNGEGSEHVQFIETIGILINKKQA